MTRRRPLARLTKFHKGKRGVSQQQSHAANLYREFREDDLRIAREWRSAGLRGLEAAERDEKTEI